MGDRYHCTMIEEGSHRCTGMVYIELPSRDLLNALTRLSDSTLLRSDPKEDNGFLNQTWEYGLPPLQLTISERQPDGSFQIQWTGEAPPHQLQSRTDVYADDWQNAGTSTDAAIATVQTGGEKKFFRVLSRFR